MKDSKLDISVLNDGRNYRISLGSTLGDLSAQVCRTVTDPKTGKEYKVLAAFVDNELKELSFKPSRTCHVEFLGYCHPDGRSTYIRSLCFILQKAASDIFPDKTLYIDHSLPSGLYFELQEGRSEDGRAKTYSLNKEEIEAISKKMEEIISRDLPFTKKCLFTEDACKLFLENNQPLKAELQRSRGIFSCNVSYLDGRADTFHGPLVPSTGYIRAFPLSAIGTGVMMQLPTVNDIDKIISVGEQTKIANALKEYSDWCSIVNIRSIGSLNKAIQNGRAVEIINMAESLHERNYARIADMIHAGKDKRKIVMIAGPSSSGKTSSSLRIALQCKVLGLNPKVIELDNYFVDRDKTPLDEDGKPDFESIHAMDLEHLNKQLNQLISGEEVEIPKFDFKSGSRVAGGKKLHLEENDILIMEGIHALNPEMTPEVDDSKIFRVYVSALTSLNIDENNHIHTSDNRLLRRMVRDNRVRGITPEETIMRWYSVRRGESRNIFPFQENADILFNSALIFELPMLKYYAEPLLRRIAHTSPAYSEAIRMLKFLELIVPLQPSEIAAIPPISIMREFIGGQTL